MQWHWEQQNLWRQELPVAAVPAAKQPHRVEPPPIPIHTGILFNNVARQLGIDYEYYNGAEGNFYIMETVGGGVGVFDFNQDGLMDLFFPNGANLGPEPARNSPRWRLYANRDALGFGDVSREAGVDQAAFAHGAAVADFDNDGFEDLFVTGFGRTVLYHNAGDGTFTDATDSAGVFSDLWSTSAAYADLDGDGQLDLYVCTYGEVSLSQVTECEEKKVRIHCGPQKYLPQADLLFHNLGDGTFCETARNAGIDDDTGRGLAVTIADLTGDHRPDIFVANDSSQNFLFVNQGNFQFKESGLSLGVALTGAGHYMASMSAGCADYDLNGWLDLFVTNFYGARSALFRNLGTSGFFDQSETAGLAVPSQDRLGFGATFIDADLDGYPDLVVANGHVSDLTTVGIPYKMRQQFFRNRGNGTFGDESDNVGAYFQRRLLGRGVASADIDDDGRPDLIVCHIGDPAAILLNRTEPHGHWLGLTLVGTHSNRDAIGVTVRVALDERSQYYEVVGGSSYLSTSDRRIIVGLGSHRSIESLEVEWPSGRRERWPTMAIDRYHSIVEPLDEP